MCKIITDIIECCNDCPHQLELTDDFWCNKLNSTIDLSEDEDFPSDCPLEDD